MTHRPTPSPCGNRGHLPAIARFRPGLNVPLTQAVFTTTLGGRGLTSLDEMVTSPLSGLPRHRPGSCTPPVLGQCKQPTQPPHHPLHPVPHRPEGQEMNKPGRLGAGSHHTTPETRMWYWSWRIIKEGQQPQSGYVACPKLRSEEMMTPSLTLKSRTVTNPNH